MIGTVLTTLETGFFLKKLRQLHKTEGSQISVYRQGLEPSSML